MRRAKTPKAPTAMVHLALERAEYEALRERARLISGTVLQQVRLAVRAYLKCDGGASGAGLDGAAEAVATAADGRATPDAVAPAPEAVAPAAEAEVRDVCGE